MDFLDNISVETNLYGNLIRSKVRGKAKRFNVIIRYGYIYGYEFKYSNYQ